MLIVSRYETRFILSEYERWCCVYGFMCLFMCVCILATGILCEVCGSVISVCHKRGRINFESLTPGGFLLHLGNFCFIKLIQMLSPKLYDDNVFICGAYTVVGISWLAEWFWQHRSGLSVCVNRTWYFVCTRIGFVLFWRVGCLLGVRLKWDFKHSCLIPDFNSRSKLKGWAICCTELWGLNISKWRTDYIECSWRTDFDVQIAWKMMEW